jgi:hypothetical protein
MGGVLPPNDKKLAQPSSPRRLLIRVTGDGDAVGGIPILTVAKGATASMGNLAGNESTTSTSWRNSFSSYGAVVESFITTPHPELG